MPFGRVQIVCFVQRCPTFAQITGLNSHESYNCPRREDSRHCICALYHLGFRIFVVYCARFCFRYVWRECFSFRSWIAPREHLPDSPLRSIKTARVHEFSMWKYRTAVQMPRNEPTSVLQKIGNIFNLQIGALTTVLILHSSYNSSLDSSCFVSPLSCS